MALKGFRPDVFFNGDWAGWGVSRDLSGIVRDRFTVTGAGVVSDAGRHFRLKEHYTFQDGREDRLDWEIVTDDQGVFAGRDHINQVAGVGYQSQTDYHWTFKRRVPTALGSITVAFNASYFQVASNRVICTTRLTRLGVPIATLVSAYKRQEPASMISSNAEPSFLRP